MRIFIGSSSEALDLGIVDDLAYWIEALGHKPIRWNDPAAFPKGHTILGRLVEIGTEVDAAVLVFTGDDTVEYRSVVSPQPRDNVLLEYGLFCGSLGGPERVFIARYGRTKMPADLGGIIHASLDATRPEASQREIRLWVEGLGGAQIAPRRRGEGGDDELSQDEQRALGLLVSDPQAAARGAWLYPLHQQLTFRGFSDAGATAVLDSLRQKGAIEYVEVETEDPLTERPSKAPAYRATSKGMSFVERYEAVRQFREHHTYEVVLKRDEERNARFLDGVLANVSVQRQTRFVIEDDPARSRIKIWSYEPLDEGYLRELAARAGAEILSIQAE